MHVKSREYQLMLIVVQYLLDIGACVAFARAVRICRSVAIPIPSSGLRLRFRAARRGLYFRRPQHAIAAPSALVAYDDDATSVSELANSCGTFSNGRGRNITPYSLHVPSGRRLRMTSFVLPQDDIIIMYSSMSESASSGQPIRLA